MTLLLALGVSASEGINWDKAHGVQVMALSDQQLEKLKDTAEFLYPNDPHKQWYLIMVELESYYSNKSGE